MKLLGKRSLTLLLALVMSVSLVIPETMAEEDVDDIDDIEIESVAEEEEPEDIAVEYENEIVSLTSDDYVEYENEIVPLTSDNAVDESNTKDEGNDSNISISPYKSGNSDFNYTSFAPKDVMNVSAYNDVVKAATAGMDTSVLSYLGLNVVSTDFYGLYPEGNLDIDLYLLTFGSEANENPDPYLWNFYYNKYTYGLNSDVYAMDAFGDWKGDYTILNDATDGKDSGESDGSKQYIIDINGAYKICDPLFFYEPKVLLGSSNASYDGGLAYYQYNYNPFYNPLEVGGWDPDTYCLNDGTFNSTVAMANAVYQTGQDIGLYLDEYEINENSRYDNGSIYEAGTQYSDFALGIYYYITGRLESNLDSWHLDMAKYCTGVSVSSNGIITITNDGTLDNRYKQYLSDIGELAETGKTYSSYGDVYNDGIRLIIGDLSDLTNSQRMLFNRVGIKLIDTNTEEGLPGTIDGGLNTDSADTILGVPYFAGLLYKDQTGVSEWDMVAYYVENLCYVNPGNVTDVMDAMFTDDDDWSVPSEDYNDTVYEMIDYGGAYYEKYLYGSGLWLAEDDGWFISRVEWPTGTAFAIYSADDNSLTFYCDSSVPTSGTTYNGKTVTDVYTGFDDATYSSYSSVPWYSVGTDILTVEFDSSFKAVTPVSTAYWFYGCTNWVESSGWQYFNTSQVTMMQMMFGYCSSLSSLDLSSFNTSRVTNMNEMFFGCSSLRTVDTSTWNTSNATDMTGMFYNCYELQYLNVASWDTSKVRDVARMFCDCYELNFILSDDDTFTMQAVEDNGSRMFYNCYKLNGGNGYPYQYISNSSGNILNHGTDYTLAHVDTPDNPGYLTDISMLQSEDKIPFAVYGVVDDRYQLTFSYDSLSEYIDEVFVNGSKWHNFSSDQICFIPEDASDQDERSWSQYSIYINEVSFDDGAKGYQPTSMAYWFYWFLNCDNYQFAELDTSKVISMKCLFYYCESLSAFDSTSLDFFDDTSNVTDMSSMFRYCKNLETLDVTKFNTSKVTDMSYMFENCSSLEKLDVTNFNTSNVTNMGFMFYNCTNLNDIDVSRFNVQNVETLYGTFMFCRSLTSIDVSKWDVSSCYHYMRMFYGCSQLTELDLSGWDTRYFDTYWESKDNDEEYYTALANFAVNCGPLDTIIIGDNFTLFADDKNHLSYIGPMVDVQYWYKECALVSDDYMCGVSGAGTYTTYQSTHSWGTPVFNWSTNYNTCTATFTCTVCGDQETVNCDIAVKTTDPTCTAKGSTVYTASVTFDGKQYTDTKSVDIDALGHNWGSISWTWDGYTKATASRTCSRCNETEIYNATITLTSSTSPTCTATGTNVYTASVTIDGTQYTNTHSETIAALGHDYGDAVFTWNTSNYTATAQRTCSRCGNNVTMQADIAYQTTAATCTTDGKTIYTASATFTYDNKTFTDTYEVTIPATGHTWGTLTWTWNGYTSATASRTCSKCNTTETYTATITSTTTNPTCTTDGRTTYTATVTVDGQSVSDTKVETLPATGHSYGEPVWTWSAKSSGGYNVSAARTCANCGDVVSVTADVTSQTDPATCTEGGTIVYTASAYFSYDSKTYTDTRTDTIAATGHDWSTLTWTWNGYTSATASRTCSKCNITETYTATITVVSTEPTCTTAGSNVYTATVTVDGVKQTNTKTETLSALGHDYGDPVWTWSTNHMTATATRSCSRCDNTVSTTANATTSTTNPTCTTDGQTVYSVSAYFSYDGKTFEATYTEVIPATGHNWGAVTFTWSGYTSATASRTCLNGCNTTETATATITSVTTDPTCTADGQTVYTATATFDGTSYESTKTEKLDALGHNWSDVVFTWADDYSSATASRTCSRCNITETATATITYTTPTAQTCTQDGLRIYTATVTLGNSKYTDTVEQKLPAYGHSYGDITFTWSSDYSSATAQRVCSTCGYIDKKDATVKKVVTDPTCLDDGNTVYTATVIFDDGQTGSSERVTYQDALGHDWEETDTDTDSTHIAVTFKCSRCGTEKHETVMTEVTSKTGMTGGFSIGDIEWHEFISEEEMLELDEDAVIDFVVDIEDINTTVSTSDKNLIQNAINNDSRASVFYVEVDISMYITNNGSTSEYELHDTPDTISIHITLPESMRFTEQGKYQTVRVHNNEATMLETTVDDDWLLTFKSDKFSTYGLVFLADYMELTVVKQGHDSNDGLQGAYFALQNSDGYWYTPSAPDENGNITANWQSTQTSRVTDINGEVTFPGLPDGTYTLYETGAPAGYYPLTETIQFIVSGGLITLVTQSDSYWLSGDRTTLYISDRSGNVFPESGSTGTGIYIGTGLALLGATFVLIIFRRKKVMAK